MVSLWWNAGGECLRTLAVVFQKYLPSWGDFSGRIGTNRKDSEGIDGIPEIVPIF